MTSEATTATPLEVLNEALEVKVCTKCGESKALGEFSLRKDSGKRRNECNPCRAAYAARLAALTPEQKAEARAQRENTRDLPQKVCAKCEESLPITRFSSRVSGGPLRGTCRACDNAKGYATLAAKKEEKRLAAALEASQEHTCRLCTRTLKATEFPTRGKEKARRKICAACVQRTLDASARGARVCTECRQEYPIDAFSVNSEGRKHSWCKTCQHANDYAYIKAHREEHGRRASARGKSMTRRLASTRSRARLAGVPFDLTVEDIFVPEFCPVLGIRLEEIKGRNVGLADTCPSLDRLIPSKGYVRGNVNVISGLANRIKTNATTEQVARVAEWMRKMGAP